jgi:hypothetical protein
MAGADDGNPISQKDVVVMNSIWLEHVKKDRTILKLNLEVNVEDTLGGSGERNGIP